MVTTAFCVPRWSFFYFLKEIKEGKITSFWKLRIAIIFRLCAKRSLVLLQAWLRRLVKKSWYMFRRRFLQRKFLEGLLFFPHFPKFSKNFLEFWRKKFGRVVTTTFIHVYRHVFRKVIFLSKSSEFFSWFLNLSGKYVDSQRNLFATVVKIAFSVAKESFLMKKITLFKKLYFQHFWITGNFFVFLQQSYARLAKTSLCMLDERFGEKQLCRESAQFFHHFRNSSKRFSKFWQDFSGSVVTTAFCVPRLSFFFNFWRREMKEKILLFENFALLSFSGFERKRSFVLLQAWLRRACQKFVVHVQTKIFTNKFFGRLFNFSSFLEIQQKFFRDLTRKIRQGGHNYFYTCT